MDKGLARRLLAEVFGTFLLVFVGCGAVVTNTVNADGASGLISIAFAFGFALMVVVYVIGRISGAHVNSAVTLSLAATGKFPIAEVIPYWIAQIAGSLAAAGVLRATFGNVANLGTAAPTDTVMKAFVVEVVMTAVLVFAVYGAATDRRAPAAAAGLAIGGALLLGILVAGPISGGAMNPARAIGPALVSGHLSDLWIYLTAPFIGGLIAAFAFEAIRDDEERGPDEVTTDQGTTTESERDRARA